MENWDYLFGSSNFFLYICTNKQLKVKDMDDLRLSYNRLILKVLVENHVEQITFKRNNNFYKHYSLVRILDGKLEVCSRGFDVKFDKFHFDFSIDYATLLYQIESDLFLATRNGKTAYMNFKFAKNVGND